MRVFYRRGAETPRNHFLQSDGLTLCVSATLRLALLLTLPLLVSCSVPNLESPDCTTAKTPVREFYSFHFGNDMTFSVENLERRKEYLTPEFYDSLRQSSPSVDPFTRTDDLPKAFRVGECRPAQSGVQFDVLLFWKTDTRTEQRSIRVNAAERGGKWLVSGVSD